jgi:hypothetical protein
VGDVGEGDIRESIRVFQLRNFILSRKQLVTNHRVPHRTHGHEKKKDTQNTGIQKNLAGAEKLGNLGDD